MIKNIITIILSLIVCAWAFYINQYAGVLQIILTLLVYWMVLFSIHYFWRSFRKKSIMDFNQFMRNFALSATSFIVIITASLGYFGYYHNIQNPLTIEQNTISNGEKTVVFQNMIHIWSENFYEKIAQEITKYKQDGYVYFFEWVKLGSQESSEAFDKALGVEFDENLYKNMSKLYWLVPQDNSKFLWLVNNLDFNVDTNMDNIIQAYNDLKIERNVEKEYKTPVDINGQTIETLASLQGRELQILVFINQAILSAMTKNDAIMKQIQNTFWNEELFEVILHGRNKIVAEEIIQSEYDKIFATYGALHFEGILEILQQNDPNWKIVETKEFLPFE